MFRDALYPNAQDIYDETLQDIMRREMERSLLQGIKDSPISPRKLWEIMNSDQVIDPPLGSVRVEHLDEYGPAPQKKPNDFSSDAYPASTRYVYDSIQSLQAQLYSANLEADRLRTELATLKTQRLSSTWEHLSDDAALLTPNPIPATTQLTKAPIPLRALQHARQPIGLLTERP